MTKFEIIYLIGLCDKTLNDYHDTLEENEITLKRLIRENDALRGKIINMTDLKREYIQKLNKLDINAQTGENIDAKK